MLYFRMLFTMVISLYTSRIILNTLGVEDFGIYNVVGGIVTMFAFFNSAMSSATQRFLSFEMGNNDLPQLKKVFSATLTIHIAIAAVILILSETLGLWFFYQYMNIPPERLDAALWVYHFSVLTFLIGIVQVPYNASIIANEKMEIYAYMSIVEVALKLGLVFLLTWMDYDKLKLFVVLLFLLSFAKTFFYRIYCKKKFKECHYQFQADPALYKKLVAYSGWNLFGNLAAVAKGQGVNILLNIFFGPAINAARGVAFQVQTAVQSFVSNFQMAANPQIIKSYASNDRVYMMGLIFKSARISFYLLFLISLPILIDADYILRIWLKIVPEFSALFTRLIIINALIDCVSGPLMTAAQATGNIKKYQVVVGSLLLLNLPVTYLVLRLGYPPETAFYVSIALSIVALMLRLFILRGLIQIKIRLFFGEVVFRSLWIVILSALIPFFVHIRMDEGPGRLLLVTALSWILTAVVIFTVGLKHSERGVIIDKMKIALKKFKGK